MSQPDYGFFSRLLHRIVLGPRFIGQTVFDLEEMSAGRDTSIAVSRPVFIAGLARSGSTILLNALHQTGLYRSLTYRDMPFVLMSGTWKRLSTRSRIDKAAKERAHGDRLLVDYDSPEAFEEVFWRTFYGEKYITNERVVPHNPPKSVRRNFSRFVHHVIASRTHEQQNRYLSKNNNNLLRLPAIKRTFADALIIVPFRDPLQQAMSLLRQHELFSERHAHDKFSMDYMNWLGHYEFGLGRKHYAYSEASNPHSPMDINYWLQGWHDAYKYALQKAPQDTVFIGYEQLCQAPETFFLSLFSRLGLDTAGAATAASFYEQAHPHPTQVRPDELTAACEQIHSSLLERAAL